MGVSSFSSIVMLVALFTFLGRGSASIASFPGLCRPLKANQTSEHCSALETLIQEHGNETFCNSLGASCYHNVIAGPSSRNEDNWGHCYCDPLCKDIGDCCPDYEWWNNHREPHSKTEPLREVCRRKPSNKIKEVLGYIMVASCPSSWKNETTAHACMSTNYSADPATALPLLDVTTNVTFANIYCAICHGKSSNLRHWNLLIKGRAVPLQNITSANIIWEAVPVIRTIPKKCMVTPKDSQLGPDTLMKQLCRTYGNGITLYEDDGTFEEFKNPHCVLLSRPNAFVNQTVRCLRTVRVPSRLPTMLFVFSSSYSNSNSMNINQLRQTRIHVRASCPINEIYDPFKERCLRVHINTESSLTNASEQCRGPSFSSNEFVIFRNDSVFITPYKQLYNNGSYTVVNHTLILCSANFSRNYTKTVIPSGHVKEEEPTHSLVLLIITYVGFSLSIISLLFLLVTYFLFAELRTYAGKKVMHLSCAMIAMQSVYFVSDPDLVSSAVCAVMGALLHFFILVVFLWMSVIARSTHKSFSTLSVNPHNPLVIARQRKAYIRYCAFAWGFPLLVVGICVALQFANVGNIGYGVQDGCQLSIPARTFAVTIPVTASLLYNIIAMIISVLVIRQHNQGNMAASQSNRKLPMIVLRLTVVTGVTWILGSILAFYATPYLEFPFVILNSCQGVMICFSFVCKKNVFNLYKQRFCSVAHPEPTSSDKEKPAKQENQENQAQQEDPQNQEQQENQ